MRSRLLFIFLLSVLCLSTGWTRYGEDEDSYEEDASHSDSSYEEDRRDPEVFKPRFTGDFLGWQEKAGVRGQIWHFLRDPKGLEIDLGFARSSFVNIFFDNPTNTDLDQSLQDLRSADNMWGPKIGFKLGRAYLDLFVSPYLGNTNALYIEATSGIWMWGNRDDADIVYFSSGIFFYGAVLAFKEPVFNRTFLSSYENHELEKVNSGWGYVHLGLGLPAIIGFKIQNISLGDKLRLHRIDFNIGAYARAGVLLPTHTSFSLGMLGPNVDIFLREEFGLYFTLHPIKTDYNTSQLDFGIRFKF